MHFGGSAGYNGRVTIPPNTTDGTGHLLCYVSPPVLCKKLVTRKLYELWWTFVGPNRYGIREFVLVTGLNCGKATNKYFGT